MIKRRKTDIAPKTFYGPPNKETFSEAFAHLESKDLKVVSILVGKNDLDIMLYHKRGVRKSIKKRKNKKKRNLWGANIILVPGLTGCICMSDMGKPAHVFFDLTPVRKKSHETDQTRRLPCGR